MKNIMSIPPSFCIIYVMFPSKEEAEAALFPLIQERLVACGNIIEGVKSVYQWKGAIESAQECILLMKTRSENYSRVEKRIAEIHSYETPCICKIGLDSVFAPYAQWIQDETEI